MVAKSYQHMEIICDPYTYNGRKYVDVRNDSGYTQRVRYYTEAEYIRMYGEKAPRHIFKSFKDELGFTNDYITIFKGNTYPVKDWFKENGARYSKLFNWYVPSTVEDFPFDEIPEGIEPLQIPWSAVSLEDRPLPDSDIRAYIQSLMYEPSPSTFQGEIGDRIEATLTVTRAITLNGYYGTSIMHIFEDIDSNVYVWTTASVALHEGATYAIRGTIKDHKEYKGTQQTILTRCKYQIIDGESE